MIPYLKNVFTINLRISSSFLHIFPGFFLKFMNSKFDDFWIQVGLNPSNFGKMRWICLPCSRVWFGYSVLEIVFLACARLISELIFLLHFPLSSDLNLFSSPATAFPILVWFVFLLAAQSSRSQVRILFSRVDLAASGFSAPQARAPFWIDFPPLPASSFFARAPRDFHAPARWRAPGLTLVRCWLFLPLWSSQPGQGRPPASSPVRGAPARSALRPEFGCAVFYPAVIALCLFLGRSGRFDFCG
jgi:hypothetical protein